MSQPTENGVTENGVRSCLLPLSLKARSERRSPWHSVTPPGASVHGQVSCLDLKNKRGPLRAPLSWRHGFHNPPFATQAHFRINVD